MMPETLRYGIDLGLAYVMLFWPLAVAVPSWRTKGERVT